MSSPDVRVFAKAMALLNALIEGGQGRTVAHLASDLGMPAATAYRLVATLERQHFLFRVRRGHYMRGSAVWRLADQPCPPALLAAAARPVLRNLARATGRTAQLGILDGDMVTYLVKETPVGVTLFTREGMQLEAYCSAIGKMLLAALPRYDLQRYLAAGQFVRLTPTTIIEAAALSRDIISAARRGYAIDQGEMDQELQCLSIPLKDDSGKTVAAISVSARETVPWANIMPELLKDMRASAIDVSARLYGSSIRSTRCRD